MYSFKTSLEAPQTVEHALLPTTIIAGTGFVICLLRCVANIFLFLFLSTLQTPRCKMEFTSYSPFYLQGLAHQTLSKSGCSSLPTQLTPSLKLSAANSYRERLKGDEDVVRRIKRSSGVYVPPK